MSWTTGAAGGAAGGAYGAARGKFVIRRYLDTWRTSMFVVVLAVSTLVAVLSTAACVAIVVHLPDWGSDDVLGGLIMAPIAGLLLVSALRMIADASLRWWWRGHRTGQPVLATAPSGVASTALLRSRAGLLVPFLVAVLFVAYGAGCAVLIAVYGSPWGSLPFVAWGTWGLAYLAPFLVGRVAAGGLYLTVAGLEHRFGTESAFIPWDALSERWTGEPVWLDPNRGAWRRKAFWWNIPGDPVDAARRGAVSMPGAYLPASRDQVTIVVRTYTDESRLRADLGTPRSLEPISESYGT